jgi:hypothetical protein
LPPRCREQNEAEFARRQDDIGDLERRRLAAEAMKEAAKEEVFHLKQSIGRARKRLDEDRSQPIDILVQVVYLQESHPFRDPHFRPHHVFNGFRSEDLRSLLEEVEQFQVRLIGWNAHACSLAEPEHREAPCLGRHSSAGLSPCTM